MLDSKATLRKELLAFRKSSPFCELNFCELEAYPEFVRAEVVFCYVSAHGEVGTRKLIEELLTEKEVVVPYCIDKEGNMICVKINSLDDLQEGCFGIPEPKTPIEFPKEKIDFAIVPGITFDRKGYRLGYGKGYYDRFLQNIKPFKLGVCQKRFFQDSIPHDEFDVKMDNVLLK